MACTTILVGKNASYDESTLVARNDDAGGAGHYAPKKLAVLRPEDLPRVYQSVISHVQVELPEGALRCTAMPNALPGRGIWAAGGINAANVAMTATETITSNARVLGADPLVEYVPAEDGKPEQIGGIGEEDIVCLVLPYIRSAREGVARLGKLLETYGTYEKNGIAFQDVDEIWWFETIGGHHWIAKRVPDDSYVVMANQLGIDHFDLIDGVSEQKNHMCSADMREFTEKYSLAQIVDGVFSAREAFGSFEDADHVYNTPRVWHAERYFNPHDYEWDGEDADYTPRSDDLPWSLEPERKITVEDVKYVLSSHYQGTPYDVYASRETAPLQGIYRPIGINRTNCMAITQLRPDMPEDYMAVEWVCFASNVFNVLAPVYANVDEIPAYYEGTNGRVSTDSFYWTSRLISALADAAYKRSLFHIERYQLAVQSKAHALINQFDDKQAAEPDAEKRAAMRREANEAIADMVRRASEETLLLVLNEQTGQMKNAFTRADA